MNKTLFIKKVTARLAYFLSKKLAFIKCHNVALVWHILSTVLSTFIVEYATSASTMPERLYT